MTATTERRIIVVRTDGTRGSRSAVEFAAGIFSVGGLYCATCLASPVAPSAAARAVSFAYTEL